MRDRARPASVRVIVLILSLDREPWRALEEAQRQTWASPAPGVQVLYLRGITRGPTRAVFLALRRLAKAMRLARLLDRAAGLVASRFPVTLGEGVLRTRTFEYWIGTSAKTHAGLRHLAKHASFDYLVRTNSSTYVHMPSLLEHLASAPTEGYYAGADQGAGHAQGTLVILTPDVVNFLAADKRWDYDSVDDEALGSSAARGGYLFTPLRQNVIHASAESIRNLPLQPSPSDFIYRFKNRSDRHGDAVRMRALHEHLTTI